MARKKLQFHLERLDTLNRANKGLPLLCPVHSHYGYVCKPIVVVVTLTSCTHYRLRRSRWHASATSDPTNHTTATVTIDTTTNSRCCCSYWPQPPRLRSRDQSHHHENSPHDLRLRYECYLLSFLWVIFNFAGLVLRVCNKWWLWLLLLSLH